MRKLVSILVITGALILGAVACGDDDSAGGADTEAEETADSADTEPGAEDEAAPNTTAEPIDPDELDVEVFGEGTATITLDNGEVFESGVACTLQPQVAAGQEILFTATAFDGSLDVTQFGEEGPTPGLAAAGVYDAQTYDVLWASESRTGELTLTLEDSTITGSGQFLAGGELEGETVAGTIEVSC